MEKIRFGIVGCSNISQKHAEALASINEVIIAAVCDVNRERANAFAEKYKAKSFYNFEWMLEEADLDVVNICTPSGLHAAMGVQAAEHKRHVIVEKPLALNLDDADRLIAACKENGVTLGVVHQNRFSKPIQMARNALESDMFGKLTHINATVRWNRNDAYYKEAKWRGTWSMDGGCLLNQAIHNIDLLRWFLGQVDTVYAQTPTMLRQIEAPDVGLAIVKGSAGTLGIVEAANTIFPRNLEESLYIFGEKGTVGIGPVVSKIKAWRFENDYLTLENDILAKQDNNQPEAIYAGHRAMVLDFIDAVKEGRDPLMSGEEGRKTVELILAMYKSSEMGLPVRLPLESSYRPGGIIK